MSINGFVLNASGISRYSLIMVMAAATDNAITQVCSKCNDSIAGISKRVCAFIYGILFQLDNSLPNTSDDNLYSSQKKAPGKAADSGNVVMKQILLNGNRRVNHNYNIDYAFRGPVIAGERGSYNQRSTLIIEFISVFLIFLAFIFAIRQRKRLSESGIINVLAS